MTGSGFSAFHWWRDAFFWKTMNADEGDEGWILGGVEGQGSLQGRRAMCFTIGSRARQSMTAVSFRHE